MDKEKLHLGLYEKLQKEGRLPPGPKSRRRQLFERALDGNVDAALELLQRYSDGWRDRERYPDEDE